MDTKPTKTRSTAAVAEAHYSHLPDVSEVRALDLRGRDVATAIALIRGVGRREFGNLGRLYCQLSDGTELAVVNTRAEDRAEYMSSQRIERRDGNTGRVIRRYPWGD